MNKRGETKKMTIRARESASQPESQEGRKVGRDSATCHDIVLAVLQFSVQLEYIL